MSVAPRQEEHKIAVYSGGPSARNGQEHIVLMSLFTKGVLYLSDSSGAAWYTCTCRKRINYQEA